MTITGPDGLQRIKPGLPAHAVKTFQIRAPLRTHFRPATCAEVQCPAYLNGWRTIVPADSAAAEYIRHDRSRSHAEERRDGGLACFTFGPGQQAFASPEHEHRVPNDREPLYSERGGDWRGNPRREGRELAAADWVDSFANHQIKLAERLERG